MESRPVGMSVAREATLWVVILGLLGAFLYAVANAAPGKEPGALGPQPAPVLGPALSSTRRTLRPRVAVASAGMSALADISARPRVVG